MSPAQQRGLALWAALLSAAVCLGFLPVSRLVSVLVLLTVLGLILALWTVASRRAEHDVTLRLDDLPEATYRQPVVLVCGDLPLAWPQQSPVLTVTQGCWVRVEDHQDLEQAARQVLWLRPDWGRQLSVMVSVCPQKHADNEALISRLLALRWQISQLRKETGHSVPLVLNGQVGCAMTNDMLWQAAILGEERRGWRESSAPSSIAAWVTTGGSPAMQQQVLMNSLMSWFHQHVNAVFMDENPDVPVIAPVAVLWGMGPILAGSLATSAWTAWLSRHTAMQQVAGWQPVGTDSTVVSPFPDFILPLLPEGRGLTPHGRTWRCALGIFTLAAIAALLSSGWNNRQLQQRVSFDIARYDRISMHDFGPKADAVAVLRDDAAELDDQARNGVPARMSLGLYQGERLRMLVLDAIRSYVPPPPPPKPQPKPKPIPKIVRLDSMSLFDSGKSVLKAGSTKMLVNSLVGIKAKPGWLIVVSGHTDNTGNPQLNQTLSQKRAEAVRDWMRDTGDVPE
ncbi:membrane protein, partial [Pectobacterium odoriferum]